MKASDLREKSIPELEERLKELYKDQFNCRMQKGTGQLAQVHLISEVKQDISRVKTIITEKQRSGT